MTFDIIVENGQLKAVPSQSLPRNFDKANKLWDSVKARNALEAEEKYMSFFCPRNTQFVARESY